MCGIFGLVAGRGSGMGYGDLQAAADQLFLLSESRGKEAAGLAMLAEGSIRVLKRPLPASDMIRTVDYRALWSHMRGEASPPCALIGHSRLVTNGLQGIETNNQPVLKDGLVGIHNGIVVNDSELWSHYPQLRRLYDVDTEVILSLVRMYAHLGVAEALRRSFAEIEGAASIALLFEDLPLLALATNTGSLYLAHQERGFVSFASERYILEQFLKKRLNGSAKPVVRHIKPMHGALVDLNTLAVQEVDLALASTPMNVPPTRPARFVVQDLSMGERDRRTALRRCSRCILPETFPMIRFDEQGICNVCRTYQPIRLQGRDALEQLVAQHRRDDGAPDCLVAFSGGRDSSYMLHFIKTELQLNPIAYTYDWGMVTDIARRNAARITGKLGIEHIIVSADIRGKRRNIQRNVLAWLRRPSLGMIPLFMAGDKQYFYHLERLRRQLGVRLAFLGGNPMEKTGFKTAFAGVRERPGARTYEIPAWRKLHIALYYAGQFISNPRYLNRSLWDTAHAFYSSYLMRHDFVWLYRYIGWDEALIDRVLRERYAWETAADTDTTWRIGDGTAAFYNYIYHTVAGFSENDTLRSNQVREGVLTREEALRLCERDNRPRYDAMREYAYQIGVDLDEALFVINSIPKLW